MLGQKIFYFRKLRGLTQDQLAQGICSVPHLSKIENDHETPSADMLEHLCKRLDISIKEIDVQGEITSITQELDNWYTLICNRDKKEAKRLFTKLKKQITSIQDPQVLLKYRIFTLGYQLLIRKMAEAKNQIDELEPFSKKLDSSLAYYYNLFYGLYYCLGEDYLEALYLYKQAEHVRDSLGIEDPEIYYHLALVNMNLHRTYYSINYAEKAAKIYVKSCNYLRSIDCEILLGVNLTRINNFCEAEKHLLNALEASTQLNNKDHISTIYHNLGYLFLMQDQYQKANNYFKKTTEYAKPERYEDNVRTYLCLARTCYKLHDFDHTEHWIEVGLSIAEKYKLEEFLIHFNVLKGQVNNDMSQEFETLLKNKAIPYFEEKQLWFNVAKYAEILAEYYTKKSKYKSSSYYYSLVNESRGKIYEYIT
ncbi:helix-turn-helix transcriptional regulator [Alteribacter populi]|uniref:helix-turn-helix transcriptional regulator n=1 Tax=Alteribacter populi TaxID=2011011 RepID=UPI000BBB5764|nr:helix-turn-helix transcriptional regulator [Alteribacter populi]